MVEMGKKQVVTFCGSLCKLNFKTHLEHYLMFHQMLSSVTLMVIRQTQMHSVMKKQKRELTLIRLIMVLKVHLNLRKAKTE